MRTPLLKTLTIASLFVLATLARPAAAATRTVYFSGYASITINNGLLAAFTPQCVISLVNGAASGKAQSGTISVTYSGAVTSGTLTATGSTTTSAAFTSVGGGSSYKMSPIVSYSPITASDPFCYKGSPRPPCVTGSVDLICKGYIQVSDDNPATPGFIIASGYITAVTESGRMVTGVTSSLQLTPSAPVVNQVPIIINAGKPF